MIPGAFYLAKPIDIMLINDIIMHICMSNHDVFVEDKNGCSVQSRGAGRWETVSISALLTTDSVAAN